MIRGMLAFVAWASRLLAPAEPVWTALDRFGGGRRLAGMRIRHEAEHDPRIARGFAGIFWILAAEIAVGVVALVVAIVFASTGEPEPPAVWFRSVAVLAITVTLLYFAWRAYLGWYWAYSRLRLFSRIFPIVTLVVAAIPGLYPLWMVFEQILFSLLMIGVGDILTTDRFREAFPRPAAAAPPASAH